MIKNITLIISILFFINYFGQAQETYTHLKYLVDSQVNSQIKRFDFKDSGVLKSSMLVKVYRNEHLFFDQDGKPLDCYTQSVLSNDTIYITGHMYGDIGYGFLLALFKDSCILTSFAYSDSAIYKYNKSDTTLLAFIPVPSSTQKLTLSNTPLYKEGEIVSGLVELESKAFYSGPEASANSFKIKLKAYFKTSALNNSQ